MWCSRMSKSTVEANCYQSAAGGEIKKRFTPMGPDCHEFMNRGHQELGVGFSVDLCKENLNNEVQCGEDRYTVIHCSEVQCVSDSLPYLQ